MVLMFQIYTKFKSCGAINYFLYLGKNYTRGKRVPLKTSNIWHFFNLATKQ